MNSKRTSNAKKPYKVFGTKNIQELRIAEWHELQERGPSALSAAKGKQVQPKELSPDDFIIALMGPTGSGKSTFIQLATGVDTNVGHGLQSCTSNILAYKVEIPGLSFNLIFIDTPGFDDTYKSDLEILTMISDWLSNAYRHDVLLDGLLYLHRITDNRMAGASLKNLHLFEKLCGPGMLRNVVLTTTMWEDVDKATGEEREADLKDNQNYWRPMIERGSSIRRLGEKSRAATFNVLEPLLDRAIFKNSLLIQEELVEMRMSLPATSAGRTLLTELKPLLIKLEYLRGQLRRQLQGDIQDMRTMETLQTEYEVLKKRLDSVLDQLRQLRLPIGKRLRMTLASAFHFRRKHVFGGK